MGHIRYPVDLNSRQASYSLNHDTRFRTFHSHMCIATISTFAYALASITFRSQYMLTVWLPLSTKAIWHKQFCCLESLDSSMICRKSQSYQVFLRLFLKFAWCWLSIIRDDWWYSLLHSYTALSVNDIKIMTKVCQSVICSKIGFLIKNNVNKMITFHMPWILWIIFLQKFRGSYVVPSASKLVQSL